LFNKSFSDDYLYRGNVIALGDLVVPVLFMPENAQRFYDKAERDRQHALRRIRLRRGRSIVYWNIVPWFVVAGAILVVVIYLR
jgi:hypothetical protein